MAEIAVRHIENIAQTAVTRIMQFDDLLFIGYFNNERIQNAAKAINKFLNEDCDLITIAQ